MPQIHIQLRFLGVGMKSVEWMQAEDRQPALDPLLDAGLRFVVIVRDAAHLEPPQPSWMTPSETKLRTGMCRFSGAGPLRMRPAVS